MSRLRILAAATALSAAACGGTDTARDDTASTKTTVIPAASSAMPDNPTSEDIAAYPLDMDKVRKLKQSMTNVEAAIRSDPTIETRGDNSESAAQTIARLEASPQMRRAIEQAGWTVKDYVWTTAALLQASMLEGTMASTPDAKLPAGHDARNIEFVKTHKAEIEQLSR